MNLDEQLRPWTKELSTENFEIFLEYTRGFCEKYDRSIKLVKQKTVKMDGVRVGGWCDGETMTVATKSDLFEDTYIHEFSHLTQAVEGTEVWENYPDIWSSLGTPRNGLGCWDDYLKTIAVEHDCEKRSLQFIKKYRIMNPGYYALRANIYLLYYQYVYLTNTWHSSTQCIYDTRLTEILPMRLLPLKYFNTINMEYMKIFSEAFDKK